MEGAVACFGEILLRFAACDGATLRDTAKLDVHVGGAEANVAVALANLGFATRMVSALPNNALGTLALKALRREGVDGDHVVTAEGRMGTYFLTPAAGPRGGEVVYDRARSAFAETMKPGVQTPHCKAAFSRKDCWSGCSPSGEATPSMVSIVESAASTPSTQHALTNRPSMITLQAPQFPLLQPSLAPVRPK